MAPRGARQERLQSEQEFHRDITAAVANTEAEIMDAALGDPEPEGDADTSLEEMGEGLEGDELEPEQVAGEAGEPDVEESEEDDEGQDEPQPRQRPQRQERQTQQAQEPDEGDDEPVEDEPSQDRFQGIPPAVLRQARQQAREDRQRADRLELEMAELRGAVSQMRQPAPQERPARPPEPDMFLDPEGWKRWNREETETQLRGILRQEMAGVRDQIQQRDRDRINSSFNDAANGPRGFEFDAAYRSLTSRDPRDQRARADVQRIFNAADPVAALWNWWDRNGAQDFRANVAAALDESGYLDEYIGGQEQPQRGRQNGGRRQEAPQRGPRQVFRQPVSLNSARGGGNRQQNVDPDLYDDAETSVFDYATRR